ncbi:MAG: 30S ribosomal protein S7 [Verrucomicrobiota bacterium]
MARRRRAERRQRIPDAVYESLVVSALVNTVMSRGKKATAEKIVYKAIDTINEGKTITDPLEMLNKALENAKPRLEVKSRRVGGATYQVPMEVPADRQLALALRWIVGNAQRKKGVPMSKALANELRDAASGQGAAIKKRDDVHRMAQANRAFAHLRW